MTFFKNHWQLLVITLLLFALWQTPAALPLRILVVLFHEMSHGLAAVFTGGEIIELTVSANEGGLATTRGGSHFAIASAGYVGSLLIGLILFVAAIRSDADRLVMAAFGVFTLLLTFLYIREPFALLFGYGTGAAMVLIAAFLPRDINDLVLRVIGLASMIYVPYDIFSDTIDRSHLRSDAFIMAEEYGGTTQIWGWLWIAISVALIIACLRYCLGARSNIGFRLSSQD